MLRRLVLLLLVACCAAPTAASAKPLLPARGQVLTGVAMGYELGDFTRRVGRKPAVWEHFVAVNGSYEWAIRLARGAGTRLVLHVSTAPGQDRAGSITPRAIASGRADRWLLSLRSSLAGFGRASYVRFLGEMNNCHNAYAPLSCSGASRGSAYSAAAFVAAFRRTTLIMRGGSVAAIDRRLRALHLPVLRGVRDESLPRAPIAMVWSPMTGGSPMVSALDPGRFWPGRSWTDWVATSFYSKFPNFRFLTPFYQRFSARTRLPFMFAEWGMWVNGDPGFVRSLLSWTAAHPRTRMLIYNQGKRTDGPFRLRHYPAASRALRAGLRHRRFAAR